MAIIYLVGTVAFALSGYLVGVRKRLDVLGVLLVATLTAVGGGIVRDVLLVRVPRVFVSEGAILARPPVVILLTVVCAYALGLHRVRARGPRSLFVLADSVGLVAFSLAGAHAAIDAELNLFATLLVALVTAVGGGLVRDVLVNEVPALLTEDVYGTVAVLLGLGAFASRHAGLDARVAMPALFCAGLALRLFAASRGLALPRVGGARAQSSASAETSRNDGDASSQSAASDDTRESSTSAK